MQRENNVISHDILTGSEAVKRIVHLPVLF